jgi:hypothetical protein
MDRLHAHAVKVEEAVFLRTADLFKLDVDLIFDSPYKPMRLY